MKKKSLLIIVTLLLITGVMAALTSCTTFDNFKRTFFEDQGETKDTIVIGVIEPQTGNSSGAGQLEIDGLKIANSIAPTVLGKEIKLVYADTQSNIYSAEAAVQDLIAQKPAMIIGSYGNAASLVVSDYVKKAKLPAITVTATNPLITHNNPYYFRATFSESSQGGAVADFIFNKLNLTSSAIIKVKDDDTVSGMILNFNNRMVSLTTDEAAVKKIININLDDVDYEKYVKQLKETGAKAVFMPVDLITADKIFEQVKKQKMTDMVFIGPATWHNNDAIVLQNKYPGIKIGVVGDFNSANKENTSELYKKFIKAYEKKFTSSEPDEATALAFDAYMLAVNAIERAGSTDGEKVREALANTSGFEGAAGTITFDANGDPIKPINIDAIRNNKFVSVYTVK